MAHTIKHRIISKSLFERLGVVVFDSFYNRRLLRWARHVARMPMDRMPCKLLTGWVDHDRPAGCPQTSWGRKLNKALKTYEFPTVFWTEKRSFRRTQGMSAADRRSAPLPASSNDYDTRQMARASRRPQIMPLSILLQHKIVFQCLPLG